MSEFDWLASFRKGHTNLADAIGFYLAETNAPPDLRAAYEQALIEYTDGKVKDLAGPFGIILTDRDRQGVNKWSKESLIMQVVDGFAAQGAAKSRGRKGIEKTAFELASDFLSELNLTASRVCEIYYAEDPKKDLNTTR
jgi:hypothetical protein